MNYLLPVNLGSRLIFSSTPAHVQPSFGYVPFNPATLTSSCVFDGEWNKPIPPCRAVKPRKLLEQQTQQPAEQLTQQPAQQLTQQPAEQQTQPPAEQQTQQEQQHEYNGDFGFWYDTTEFDWEYNARPGLNIKIFHKENMNLDEAKALCTSNNATIASIEGMYPERINALFPYTAWVKGEDGACEVIDTEGNIVRDSCEIRPHFVICERPETE
ncbi:hypothetical protein Q1695_014205 [Nippostrongylus brasiliensis]|nr:hypothetical protein Q1695_014205 [Nippostrongylus brasiliensis]